MRPLLALALAAVGCAATLEAPPPEADTPPVAVAANADPPSPAREPRMPSPTPTSTPMDDGTTRFGDVSLRLDPGWKPRAAESGAPAALVARLFHAHPRFGTPPHGRLYRVAPAADLAAVLAATPAEDGHAFDVAGPRKPHRLVDVAVDGVAGRMSWTIGGPGAGGDAYVRRDVVVVRGGVGWRLVLDLWFDGDEHIAHAFGRETEEIVGSWRWL